MEWINPKTDWVSTDKFNIEDYNRIKNNLAYIHLKANELYKPFEISDMGEDITSYTAYWDVDYFNAFERNLETINQNIFTKDYGVAKTFYENGMFITWEELNRIESATESMKFILDNQKNGLNRLAFRLGTFKEVKF